MDDERLTAISGCGDFFTLYEDRNAMGAVQDSQADTEAECRLSCTSKPYSQCAAFEFDTGNLQCWIHASKPSNLNLAGGVKHFSREECDISSTPDSATGVSTTPGASPVLWCESPWCFCHAIMCKWFLSQQQISGISCCSAEKQWKKVGEKTSQTCS